MVRSATWVGWSRSLLAALIAAVVTLLGAGTASASPAGVSDAGVRVCVSVDLGWGIQVGNTATTTPAGSAATTNTWTATGRLAGTSGPMGATSNVYDADGNLLIARDPAGRTLYADASTEIRYASATGALTRTYHISWLGWPVADITGTTATYLAADAHDTGVIATSVTDAVVAVRRSDPFGNVRGAPVGAWPDAHGFLDKPTSTVTGLTHLGAREYNPVTGTFISVDPILDLSDPAQWNAYGYANGNPVTLSDPAGTRAVGSDGEELSHTANGWRPAPKPAPVTTKAPASSKSTSPSNMVKIPGFPGVRRALDPYMRGPAAFIPVWPTGTCPEGAPDGDGACAFPYGGTDVATWETAKEDAKAFAIVIALPGSPWTGDVVTYGP